jgi:hypothetical protein
MNTEEIKNLIDQIANDMKKEKPEFNACLTKPGITFQNELSKLITLLRKGNLSQMVSNILTWFFDIIDNQFLSNTEIGNKKIEVHLIDDTSKVEIFTLEMKDVLQEIKIPEPFQKVFDNLPIFIEALNTYFILALFAYCDYYATTIYELIVKNNSNKNIESLLFYLHPRGNPKVQIKTIIEKLDIITEEEFFKCLNPNTWDSTFKMLIKLRNTLAHENPVVKKENLHNYFSALYMVNKELLEKIYQQNKEENENLSFEESKQLQELIKPALETVTLLTEIGKECYGYISIIDILIDDFLKS